MKQSDVTLILGTGLSTFIIFTQIPSPHAVLFKSLISIIFVALVIFSASVCRKKRLIDAFAQQVADEIMRTDIRTAIETTEKMLGTSARFTVDGLATIKKEHGVVIEGVGNEAEVLAKMAHEVTDFNEKEFGSFLYRRTTLRWAIDGLEAMIGNHKSIEVAWTKGGRYLNRFLPENDRNSLPWFPTYMKLLGLPHNFHAHNFEVKVKEALSRKNPRGFLSLFVACRTFEYRNRLRLFHLEGENAWHEMLRFKADTLDFEELKRSVRSNQCKTMPPTTKPSVPRQA